MMNVKICNDDKSVRLVEDCFLCFCFSFFFQYSSTLRDIVIVVLALSLRRLVRFHLDGSARLARGYLDFRLRCWRLARSARRRT